MSAHTPGTVVIDAQHPVIATNRFDQFGNQILENTGLVEGLRDCIIWRGNLYGASWAQYLHNEAVRDAAPDLLAALQEIAANTDNDCLYQGTSEMMRDIARAAIAKAEGAQS